MIRFCDFVRDHFVDDPEEVHHLSIDEVKSLVLDYLAVTLFQYEDIEVEDQVEVYCSLLDKYLEDADDFYDGLLIDIVNIINYSDNKNIVIQFRNRDKVREDDKHEVFSLNDDESYKESFLFVFNKLGNEKKDNKRI